MLKTLLTAPQEKLWFEAKTRIVKIHPLWNLMAIYRIFIEESEISTQVLDKAATPPLKTLGVCSDLVVIRRHASSCLRFQWETLAIANM